MPTSPGGRRTHVPDASPTLGASEPRTADWRLDARRQASRICGALKVTFPSVPRSLRETGQPLVWLTLGLLASTIYLYGASLVRVEGGYTPPVPLFPPQAVVLAVLLLTPARRWWVMLVVYYVLRVATGLANGIDPRFSLVSNVAGVVEPLIGALLLGRFTRLPPRFAGLHQMSWYATCVTAAAALGATLGAIVRLVMAGSPFWVSWQAWFLGDALASLLLTPAILLWANVDRRALRASARARGGEIAFVFAVLIVVACLVFGTRFQDADMAPALLYVPVPLLVWAAMRFDPLGLASALFILTVFAISGVANDQGPFDGRTREANLLTLQLFLAGLGVPLYFLAAIVGERRRVRLHLEQSERRYRAVVSNFPQGGVLLFGADQRHIFADGQGLRDAGLAREQVEGKTPTEAFPPDVAAALAPHYAGAVAGRRAAFDLVHAGRTYYTQVVPITNAGSASGMVVMQDVSEQRRAEVLAELDRVKTAFFNDVSHEFRTPLTLLLGPLEELLSAPPERVGPAEREQLENAHHNAQRLLRLVNTLLDLARLEAGRLEATYEPTDLPTLTADLAGVFRSAIERAGLRLVVACPPLNELVYVDRDHWERIVFNLLSNALKFTLRGQIEVRLGMHGRSVELTVRDTGTGIPPEELPELFTRFHRVPTAAARTDEGSGIGLALVQQLVRLHGGSMRVDSVLGAGTTFTVTIPRGALHLPVERIASRRSASHVPQADMYLEDAQHWLARPSAGGGAVPTVTGARPPTADRQVRLLVADDNADMRAYIARLLQQRGVVQVVADGSAALAVAIAWQPDLILADVMMPGLDGLALLHAVRDNALLRLVPFILLSARADNQTRVDGLRAGADDYLVKPFAAAELLARVDGQLESLRARGEARAAAERRRLARDLHDSVSQTLYAANMTADALPSLWRQDPEEALRALVDLRRLTSAAQAEMRALLLELRPEVLSRAPLEELLRTLVNTAVAKTAGPVEAWLDPAPALPPDVQEALYRIAQEALHNAVKHAQPRRLTVRLTADPPARVAIDGSTTSEATYWAGTLELEVADSGTGFDPRQAPSSRLGLRSMRERATSIGADFELTSQPAIGTTIRVRWQGSSAAQDAGPPPALMAVRVT
jgi:signal transduction histidine kinase